MANSVLPGLLQCPFFKKAFSFKVYFYVCVYVTCVLVLAGCGMVSDALELGFEDIVSFLTVLGTWSISGSLEEQ